MSFQFEDDSALEELLNQQLDRRRQQEIPARPEATSRLLAKHVVADNIPPPAAASAGEASRPPPTSSSAKGKLADWLSGKNPDTIPSEAKAADSSAATTKLKKNTTSVSALEFSPIVSAAADQMNDQEILVLVSETLKEERLQEMSKQKLIQVICGPIKSTLSQMGESAKNKAQVFRSREEVERLRSELEAERSKLRVAEEKHSARIERVESSWSEINRQLEMRLSEERQVSLESSERHKAAMAQVESEWRRQTEELRRNFESRMQQQREEFAEAQRRRQEFHQAELESKLKVNAEVEKLDLVFAEWDKKVADTMRHFEMQFEEIERLLERQTIAVNASNSDLSRKSSRLSEQLDDFERRNEDLVELARQVRQVMPEFSSLHESGRQVVAETGRQVGELAAQLELLGERQLKLARAEEELRESREKIAEEKFQVRLEANRLQLRDERLSEVVSANRQVELELAEAKKQQASRVEALEALEVKLSQRSRRVEREEQQVKSRQVRVREKLQVVRAREAEVTSGRRELAEVAKESERLERLASRAAREVSQLRRLEKSLVCSICLSRIHKSSASATSRWGDTCGARTHRCRRQVVETAADSQLVVDNDDDVDLDDDDEGEVERLPPRRRVVVAVGASGAPTVRLDLRSLRRRLAAEAKQLEAENKYADLLASESAG